MPARRTEGPTPDLLAAVAGKTASADEQEIVPSLPRYRLPKDLAGALTRLDDSEIDVLLATVTREAERRGRLPESAKTMTSAKPADADRRADRVPDSTPRTKPASGRFAQAPPNDAAASLTLGQTNAVRAAFTACVKPSTIARQFGISQAAVRQALATEMRTRKS